MKRQYWDSLAGDYEDQVLSVFANDKQGVVKAHLNQYIIEGADVCDFGCGIGWVIPYLAKKARLVYAVDISKKLLKRAKRRCRKHKNVCYVKCDLLKDSHPVPKVQCAVCINVMISPRCTDHVKLLNAIHQSLIPGGILILVVPSLESQIWTYNRLFEKIKSKSGKKTARSAVNAKLNKQVKSIGEGIVKIPDADTKCFLGPELDGFVTTHGFEVLVKTEVPYSWKEELMKIDNAEVARPWHWLVAAKKEG